MRDLHCMYFIFFFYNFHCANMVEVFLFPILYWKMIIICANYSLPHWWVDRVEFKMLLSGSYRNSPATNAERRRLRASRPASTSAVFSLAVQRSVSPMPPRRFPWGHSSPRSWGASLKTWTRLGGIHPHLLSCCCLCCCCQWEAERRSHLFVHLCYKFAVVNGGSLENLMEGKDTFHLVPLVSEGRKAETFLCPCKRFKVSFFRLFPPAEVFHQILCLFISLFNHIIAIKKSLLPVLVRQQASKIEKLKTWKHLIFLH